MKSPFLFIIAMEGLNDMLKTAQINNWIRGFNVSSRSATNLEITHLQYADDTLVLCDANKEQLKVLRVIFILFEAISGLHINWSKSYLYPVNEVERLQDLADILGGRIGELPTVYLGMPLGAKSKSKAIWNGVLEKCEKKLTNWKSQYLSLGGRLTLINSVLDALPTYMMSLFPIPVNVVKRLDALRRNFLWQGNSGAKKFHLVKWDSLTICRKEGGMGIRNLSAQNHGLMMKWLWRFASNENALWKDVIRVKYGMSGNWTTRANGVSLWKSIRNLWPKLLNKCRFKTGNGMKISFWEDNWLGHTPLKQLFPDIYNLNLQQGATVADVWSNQGWNLSYRRLLNDWEIDTLTQLYSTLEQFKGTTTYEDSMAWQGGQGRFSVKSAYKEFNSSNNQIGCWPWKLIWKAKIPLKVACFTWLLTKEAVLTLDNLIKRGFHLCSRCYLCGAEAETINHLFLHCTITTQIWRIFINLKGIMWVMPRGILDVLECWNNYSNTSSHKERWKIVPACIWWSVWKERNQICFEDKCRTIQNLMMQWLALFYFWCKQEYMEDHESLVDFLGSL